MLLLSRLFWPFAYAWNPGWRSGIARAINGESSPVNCSRIVKRVPPSLGVDSWIWVPVKMPRGMPPVENKAVRRIPLDDFEFEGSTLSSPGRLVCNVIEPPTARVPSARTMLGSQAAQF